jgi:SP family sugar:H+ symporter-like MFS transporter
VDELYGLVSKAWQSKAFRPTVRFAEVEKDGERARGASLAEIAAAQERRRSSVVQAEGKYGVGQQGEYAEKTL